MKTVVKTFARQFSSMILAMTMGSAVVSCDNILAEEDVDCSVEYRVRFKYDYNMKYADAFANEVSSVTLYAFDDNGKLAFQKTEEGDILKSKDYYMTLDVDPGDYRLITWAGRLDEEASFSVPLLTEGVSTYEELKCRMDRAYSRAADGSAYIDTELTGLWHGEIAKQNLPSRAALIQDVTVPLVKNTNKIRVILQQMEGTDIDVENFEFTITDDNGYMNYNNMLLDDEILTYYPYYHADGSTAFGDDTKVEEGDGISVAIAQLTVGRLVADQKPRLTVTNRETGEEVLSVSLIPLLQLTEAEGHDMSLQEYLDRQDEYSLVFFLDEGMHWINTQIVINDWIVRFNDMSYN